MFRLRTGVSLAGIPVYFLIGIVAILSTVPSLVLGGRWIPSTVPGWDWLAAVARTSAEVGASPTFAAALAMMAKVGLALFPLVPVAALLRALRAKSHEPLWTTTWSLLLGTVSVLLFSWLVQLGAWAIEIALLLFDWWSNLTTMVAGERPLWLSIAGGVLGGAVILGIIVFGLIFLNEALGAKRLIGWGIAVGVVIVAVLVLQRSGWGGLETAGAAASTALAWGGTALTWLGVWLFRIAVGAVLVLLALGIVSQVGTNFWLPFKGAWSAGRASNSNADFAAGAGVALSVILAAASFNPGFNAWLSAQLQSLPLNPTFALDFHGWFPAASIQPWTDLFESFSGFPEFGLIVVTLFVGIVSLAFGGQGDYRETGPMAVATAAIARVTTTLLLTLIILYVLSKLRDE